jgi:hypothetical protein
MVAFSSTPASKNRSPGTPERKSHLSVCFRSTVIPKSGYLLDATGPKQ